MPKSRDSYRVVGQTVPDVVNQLNFLLQRMADRMDKIEGIRGTSSIESDLDMNSNRVTDIAEGSSGNDAARVGDLTPSGPTFTGITITGDSDLQGDVSVGGNIEVLDADGEIIHSLE